MASTPFPKFAKRCGPSVANFGNKGVLVGEFSSSAAYRFEVPEENSRQRCRNFKSAALGPLERRLAFLHEGLGRFLVIGGLAGAGVMNRFTVETGLQRHVFGIVDVALDEAERDRRP